MKLGRLFIVVAVAAAAWSAQAQTASDQAHDDYVSELGRQCPGKGLEQLSDRQLRDGLDDYMGGVPQDARDVMQKAEADQCSALDASGGCVNTADIGAADSLGRMPDLVSSICASFLRCRAQGDCDYAR